MQRRSWVSFVFIGLLVAMMPLPAGAAVPAAQRDVLILRMGAGNGGAVVAVAARSGKATRLPAGLYSTRTHTLYAVQPGAGGASSTLRAIDAATGQTWRTLRLPGQFVTNPAAYDAATLSFNGRWLALRAVTPGASSTTVVVINTSSMRIRTRLQLAGSFGLDTLDTTGEYLYLIEALPQHGAEAYDVRSYNLVTHSLDATPVLEKGEAVGTMSGVAQTRAWSTDGSWLFTFYIRPGNAGAFIHSLGLGARTAHCIFLTDKGVGADQLSHYALAVAPDGNSLYAINPVLGRVLQVRRSSNSDLPFGSLEIADLGVHAASPANALNGAVVSRNSRSMFVATQQGVWVIDANSLARRTTFLAGESVASVALSADGQRLYALDPARGVIQAVDAKSGRALGSIKVRGAWAIEQAMR